MLAAVLQIMDRESVDEPTAFSMIRRAAMEQRQTIEQLAAQIVAHGVVRPRRAAG